MEFAQFMATNIGRLLRILAGMILVLVGLYVLAGVIGIVSAILGLLLIAAGLFNFCFIAPLLGAPFWGKDLNKKD
jgi:uncharacterized membrane protein